MNDREREITALINAERAARGIAPLTPDERLVAAARGHSEDMAAHPGMVHVGSDGNDGGWRIWAAGYNATRWAEVVGWGFEGQAAAMVNWWLNSPDHAPRLLDAAMTDIGAGYATGAGPGGHYWAVDFAAGDSQDGETFWAYAPVTMGGG